MNSFDNHKIDRRQMRKAFDRAAQSYDESAVLQKEVCRRLLERLDIMTLQPRRVLDLGAGTGEALVSLMQRYPNAEIIAIDIARDMLQQAKRKLSWWQRFRQRVSFVTAEAERLPLADNSIDLLISSLTFQWCDDLVGLFSEIQRVLAPGGAILFTTFGPDSLKELRESWARVDSHIHVHPFIDMHDIGDAMLQASLAEPVMDMEVITVTYDDAHSVMRDLKNIGAHNVASERPRHLTGKQKLSRFVECYEDYRQQGKLPVTYEIVYGHAWSVELSKRQSSVEVKMIK